MLQQQPEGANIYELQIDRDKWDVYSERNLDWILLKAKHVLMEMISPFLFLFIIILIAIYFRVRKFIYDNLNSKVDDYIQRMNGNSFIVKLHIYQNYRFIEAKVDLDDVRKFAQRKTSVFYRNSKILQSVVGERKPKIKENQQRG